MKAVVLNFVIGSIGCALLVACSSAIEPRTTSNHMPLDSLVKAYFSTFNKHDAAGLAAFYADSADTKDPSTGVRAIIMKRDSIQQKYAQMFAYFKDLNDSVTAVYPSGNCVTVEFTSTGIGADGSKLYLPICSILEFSDNKIIKDYTYYNNAHE